MQEASWILLNSTQKLTDKIVELMLKFDIISIFEKKIEIEKPTEKQEDVILTFLEEFLKKTMRFKMHQEIKQMYRDSTIMEFLKQLACKKHELENGSKAYDIITRYFKDISEELVTLRKGKGLNFYV